MDNGRHVMLLEKALAQPGEHFGTVGVVALDQSHALAVGTSTGGLTN